jgi:Zn-finger nucleic acid-binding protein
MNCPVDGTTLQMTDRQGIEIDYCPKCRGVWLDRGELDKLVERSATPAPRPATPDRRFDDDDDDDDRYERESYDREHGSSPRKKRKSLLGELFDF